MVINYRAKRNGSGDYHNDFEVMSRRGGGGIVGGSSILGIIGTIVKSIIYSIVQPIVGGQDE